jgi:hypothetical protein
MEPHDELFLKFHSSYATTLLAQYESIQYLLGQSNHHTHVGNHCELLVSEFLRKQLPDRLAIGKGYVYGRCPINGKDSHGPEIDILIYDRQDCAPIFQLKDFVIIDYSTVRGMIQVKKTLNRTEIIDGVYNLACAKHHIARMRRLDERKIPGRSELLDLREHGEYDFSYNNLFSALIAFDDGLSEQQSTVRQNLEDAFGNKVKAEIADKLPDIYSAWLMPDFIGTIRNRVFTDTGFNVIHGRSYLTYRPQPNEVTFGLQLFLWRLFRHLKADQLRTPKLVFHETMRPLMSNIDPNQPEYITLPPRQSVTS